MNVIKPTLFVSFLSFLNYGLVFLVQIIVASYYGNSTDRDAYLIALTIPSYIVSIFISAIPSVYLPALVSLQNKSAEESWRFAQNIFFIFILMLSVIVFFLEIFSAQTIKLIAPDIDVKTFNLVLSLYVTILPSIVFNILSGLLGSVYYSCYKFFQPSLAPVISSLVLVISVLVLHNFIGIYSLAIGFLAGSVAGFLFLLPIVRNFPRSLTWMHQSLFNFFSTTSPLIFAGVIYQAVTIIQRRYASFLPPGSISSLGYGTQIITALSSILSSGVSTILFPLMSDSWAQRNLSSLRKYFSTGVIMLLAVTVPFVAFFYFLGLPFVKVIFEHGAFNRQDSIAVSNALFALSGSLVFYSLGNIVAKGFYFSGRTLWAAVQETFILFIYLYLGYFLSLKWQLNGLALATTITSGISVVSSLVFMNYLIKGIYLGRIVFAFIQIIGATLISSIFSFYIYITISHFGELFNLLFSVILQVIVYYLIVIFLFRIPELVFVQQKLFSFIRNSLSIISKRDRA